MKYVSILGATLLVASSAMAQSFYSPPSAGASEGALYSYYYGRYAAMRHMMVDGHHPATAVYKEIALRLDGRRHTSFTALGRSWTAVTVDLAPGKYTTMSRTFSANLTTSPTRVFSGSVTWATQSGTPSSSPAAWGGNGAIFPFGAGGSSSTYLHYTGSDIVVDTDFNGGKLINSARWTGSSGRSYYHDGYGSPTSSSFGVGRSVPSRRLNRTATTPCNDSAMSTTFGSYTFSSISAYGGAYSIINYRNNLRWYSYSYYCGYENPVIHAVGLNTIEPGVDLGTGCNKLHVGLFAVFYGYVTLPQAANSSGYTGYRYALIPHQASYVGLKPIVQGAFADSKTKAFVLTQAREVTIPGVMPTKAAKRFATYNYLRTSSSGRINPSGSFIYNPILRWTQ